MAIWLEGADQKVAANLAVWYQSKDTAEGHGTKWLPDLRQWWRKSGRTLEVPVDGVTGPTRPAGAHALSFSDTKGALKSLPPGQYTLVVEAAREVGGRERLDLTVSRESDTTGALALDVPVRVSGSFASPSVAPARWSAEGRAALASGPALRRLPPALREVARRSPCLGD